MHCRRICRARRSHRTARSCRTAQPGRKSHCRERARLVFGQQSLFANPRPELATHRRSWRARVRLRSPQRPDDRVHGPCTATGSAASRDFGRERISSGNARMAVRTIVLLTHHGSVGSVSAKLMNRTSNRGYLSSTGRCVAPGSWASNIAVHHGSTIALSAAPRGPSAGSLRRSISLTRASGSKRRLNESENHTGTVEGAGDHHWRIAERAPIGRKGPQPATSTGRSRGAARR